MQTSSTWSVLWGKIDLSETEGRKPVGVPAENSEAVDDSHSGRGNVHTVHEDKASHETNTKSAQGVISTSSGSCIRETLKPKLKKRCY